MLKTSTLHRLRHNKEAGIITVEVTEQENRVVADCMTARPYIEASTRHVKIQLARGHEATGGLDTAELWILFDEHSHEIRVRAV
jgi:hypothetical protein